MTTPLDAAAAARFGLVVVTKLSSSSQLADSRKK